MPERQPIYDVGEAARVLAETSERLDPTQFNAMRSQAGIELLQDLLSLADHYGIAVNPLPAPGQGVMVSVGNEVVHVVPRGPGKFLIAMHPFGEPRHEVSLGLDVIQRKLVGPMVDVTHPVTGAPTKARKDALVTIVEAAAALLRRA